LDKSEIQLWHRHPVTFWFLQVLSEEVWPRAEQWAAVQTWEEAVELRERERLRLRIRDLLGSLEPKNGVG
jgi:hypothetical protein